MKKFIYAVFIALAATVTGCGERANVLFSNGKSEYAIVLCSNASASERTAAAELQDYLEQIGGVVLPIMESDKITDGQKEIFIGYSKEYGAECGVACPDKNDEGYTYRTVGENIWIYGGSVRGTL